MIKKLLISIILLLLSVRGYAQTVSIENQYLTYNGKTLSSTNRAVEAKLHPGRKWVYFIKEFNKETPDEDILKDELWRVDVNGENEEMLFRPQYAAIDHPDFEKPVSFVNNIQFSPDGKKVYFETFRWVTSDILCVIDPDGENLKELGPGNGTRVIKEKKLGDDDYSGYITTNLHRYFVFGGSYDWYWLFSPDYKQVGPLGVDLEYEKRAGVVFMEDKI